MSRTPSRTPIDLGDPDVGRARRNNKASSWYCFTLLPAAERQALLDALREGRGTPAGMSKERTYALDEVLTRIRVQYPHLFVYDDEQ